MKIPSVLNVSHRITIYERVVVFFIPLQNDFYGLKHGYIPEIQNSQDDFIAQFAFQKAKSTMKRICSIVDHMKNSSVLLFVSFISFTFFLATTPLRLNLYEIRILSTTAKRELYNSIFFVASIKFFFFQLCRSVWVLNMISMHDVYYSADYNFVRLFQFGNHQQNK